MMTGIESNVINSEPIRILQDKGSLKIEFDNPDIVEICVMDLSGRIIARQAITNGNTIVINHLPTGHFILTGRDHMNRLIAKKLMQY